MGEPVRIVELVDNFARLLNLDHVAVRFTGLRPGEKLAEELFGSDESHAAHGPPADHQDRARRSRPPASGPRSSTCTTPRRTTGPTRCASTCVAWCRSTRLRRRPRPVPVPALASPYPDDY